MGIHGGHGGTKTARTTKSQRAPGKISQTILEFARPLLLKAGPRPPLEPMKQLIQLVIHVWNANVMATPRHNRAEHLEEMQFLLTTLPKEQSQLVSLLSERWKQSFSTDLRLVGDWSLTIDDSTDEFVFRCEARGLDCLR
jgi:hypothetical protein